MIRRGHVDLPGSLAWAIVGIPIWFASLLALAEPLPLIDPGSLTHGDGELTFQFTATGGGSDEFEVLTSAGLGRNGSWRTAEGSRIEAVAEGVFKVRVSLATGLQAYFRLRWNGSPQPGPAPVFNEVMADNETAYAGEDGSFWDWIELYNPHDVQLNLEGYGLTDDPAQPGRWRFPNGTIAPGGYVVVFASGRDLGLPGNAWHTDFSIDTAGETLVLSDPLGREVDRVVVPPLGRDEALGRAPDGAETWHVMKGAQVTPGTANPEVAANPIVEAPEFQTPPGFYRESMVVALSMRQPEVAVHFTTNGTPPSLADPTLATGLRIERTTLIRAVAIDAAGRTSREAVGTFFVGARHPLPVVSLAADPRHFEFRNGYLYGMGSRVLGGGGQVLQNYPYSGSNAWQDREIEAHMEFLEPDGRRALSQFVGVKIFGGWGSRGYPQKSLALFARRKYGAGRMDHRIFPGLDVDSFEAVVLRNSGNDNQSTHQTPPRPPIDDFGVTRSYGSYFVNGTFTLLRDGLMQRLVEGTGLDTQAYRPAVVYLNGEYWGIYNVREKLNEHYVIDHHELEEGSIDLIEGYGSVQAGTDTVFREMRDFVSTRNPAAEANYRRVAEDFLELDNFIDYNLAVIYFQNFDIGNIKCWRPRVTGGRFRWLVYDQDYGFGLWPAAIYEPAMARDYADYANMFRFATAGTGTSTAWPNGGGRTLLLRRMLLNADFRERFLIRCADLLNSRFREEFVLTAIEELSSAIRPEIAAHLERWSWDQLTERGFGAPHQSEFEPFTAATWERHLGVLRDFAAARPSDLRADAVQHFGLTGGLGTLELSVEPPGAGRTKINSLDLEGFPWRGVYFGDFASALVAVARPGYRFVEWFTPGGAAMENPLSWTVSNTATQAIVARFEPMPPTAQPAASLWITEINYHSPESQDAQDWLEIFNPGDRTVRLGGWVLRDDSDDSGWVLPDEELGPGDYVVFCRNAFRFQWSHRDATFPAGVFPFGLGNEGDTVRLFDPRGVLVKAIPYDDRSPWPETADGQGSTLELTRPDLDHADPAAWSASVVWGGTPGVARSAPRSEP